MNKGSAPFGPHLANEFYGKSNLAGAVLALSHDYTKVTATRESS